MNPRVRCIDCHHYVASVKRCFEHQAAIRQPRRLRACTAFSGPRPLLETKNNLVAAGLDGYVAELRDLDGGRRLLRLKHGVPEAARFEVYRLAGLKIREPKRIETRGQSQSAPASQRARQAGGQAA
jgi:hypothetical protein